MSAPVLDLVKVSLLRPAAGFVLGRSQLGIGRFGSNTETRVWTDITAEALSISTQRGGTRGELGTAIEVGTLSVALLNVVDPDVRPNAGIRLTHRITGATLYTGVIRRVPRSYTFDKVTGKRSTVTTIVATDNVQAVANTMRYGAVPPGTSETWEARVRRLMASSPVPYTIAGTADAGVALQAIVYESTLLNHLNLACTSARSRWYVDARNRVRFEGRNARPVRPVLATLSDVADPSYLDLEKEYDSEGVINDLSITNKGRVLGDNGWVADDVTYGPYIDATSRATWGEVAVSIETSLWTSPPAAAAVDRLAAQILAANRDPTEQVRSVVVDVTQVPAIAAADVYDRIDVVHDGTTSRLDLIAVAHTITPYGWTATLTTKETS